VTENRVSSLLFGDTELSLQERLPGLAEVPIIGILRRCPRDRVVDVARVAHDRGLTIVEVTLDTTDALDQIEMLLDSLPGLTIGAGTVLTASQAESSIRAGASFVVTPVVLPDIIEACLAATVPCLPGAATPTEIWTAHRLGAAAVKVFPIRELGGPAYISALREPLEGVPLVPTGGVGVSDIRAYLEAGAAAAGMGRSLFPAHLIERGDLHQIADLVTEAVKSTR